MPFLPVLLLPSTDLRNFISEDSFCWGCCLVKIQHSLPHDGDGTTRTCNILNLYRVVAVPLWNIVLKHETVLSSCVYQRLEICPGLNTPIFWDITPCSPLKVNRRFGGTCRLNIQGERIIQTRNQYKLGRKQSKLKMEVTFSYESPVCFQRTKRYHLRW
jgi:hypothetical protein